MEVTKNDFLRYKAVQASGQFNMFESRAREATGLDKGTYLTIIKEYNESEDKYGSK